MSDWVEGIKRPSRQDFEKHDRVIQKYTILLIDDDFDSTDSYDILQKVLRSANTLRNYFNQLPIGGGSKRRRGSVDAPNVSDSKCTPWKSILGTDWFQARAYVSVLNWLE